MPYNKKMKEQFCQYLINLYKGVPLSVYEGLLFLFCLFSGLLLIFCGLKRWGLYSSRFLLAEYICLLFCSTVLFRNFSENKKYDFQPFWSYSALKDGKEVLFVENLMNVVVFIPIGLLLCLTFRNIKWWNAMLIGCCISVSIEALQYFFHRGFSEFDDLMHNTLGCLIGYGMCRLFVMIIRYEK